MRDRHLNETLADHEAEGVSGSPGYFTEDEGLHCPAGRSLVGQRRFRRRGGLFPLQIIEGSAQVQMALANLLGLHPDLRVQSLQSFIHLSRAITVQTCKTYG